MQDMATSGKTCIGAIVKPCPSITIFGTHIHTTSYTDVLNRMEYWIAEKSSRYVCVCNVHSVMTAYDDVSFRTILNQSDLTTPDGMPLVWALRMFGFKNQPRVYGPTLVLAFCQLAQKKGYSIFLYGGTEDSLHCLQERLWKQFPKLKIVGSLSPPFRPLTTEEDTAIIKQINISGADVVFAGIGCPKQERWMAARRGKVQAIMVGVGAAFDFHAGKVRQAPAFMQAMGMEWLFRLCMEPRRLWKRYLLCNSRFLWHFPRQYLKVIRYK